MLNEGLKHFYNACNPLEPANASQYVDCDEARGSRDFSELVLNQLSNVSGSFLTFLFTGHLGCGKSSELRHLAELLRKAPGKPYLPIILNAEDFLDTYDVTPTDVLLSILAQVSHEFKKIGITLQDEFLRRRLQEFKELLLSEVRVQDLSVKAPLADVTAKLALLKSDPVNRRKVREVLGRDTSPLKEEIKIQFDKARNRLRNVKAPDGQPYADFVLILDNLEKIQRVQGDYGEGYRSHRQFFIESASQLTDLGAHVVYTAPLPLVIHDGSELTTLYGRQPFVLPMIKIEHRPPKRRPNPEGISILRQMLERRASPDTLDSLIEPDALEFLVGCCGGHVRQLLMFVQGATSWAGGKRIGMKAAYDAISDTVGLYSRMPARYLKKLVDLELSEDQSIDSDDDDIKAMLQQLFVLEYRNGASPADPYAASVPWYAVHPIVRELPVFKRAVAEAMKQRKPARPAKRSAKPKAKTAAKPRKRK